MLPALALVLSVLLQQLPKGFANPILSNRCASGWRERTVQNTCYWFEPASSNVSWRDALWRCREWGAELFEPVEASEMRWVEEELSPKRMSGGSEWHVYGHRDLYGKDVWHSGEPLDESFSVGLVRRNWSEEPKCEAFGEEIVFPFECALLHYNNRRHFELKYSSCRQADRPIGFICKREFTIPPQRSKRLMNVQQGENKCEPEWTHPLQDNTNVYSISTTEPSLSWYQALRKCRDKGGDLPTIESAAEAHWIRDRVQYQRSLLGESELNRLLYFFVNLHEWAYNRNGWGWSSGTQLDSSVLQWASDEPTESCSNQDICASLARNDSNSNMELSKRFCDIELLNVTLVCKRSLDSCLLKTSKRPTMSAVSSRTTPSAAPSIEIIVPHGTSEDTSKMLWNEWVPLAAGLVLLSFIVLFFVSLAVCCTLCRLTRMQHNGRARTADKLSRAVSNQSQNSYDIPMPVSQPPARASAQKADPKLKTVSGSHKVEKKKKNRRRSNKHQLSSISENVVFSQLQASFAARELTTPSPETAPSMNTFMNPSPGPPPVPPPVPELPKEIVLKDKLLKHQKSIL